MPQRIDNRHLTDYQERVQRIRARITPDADYHDLIQLHDHLLYIAPHIRIGARWGDYTSYTTKVRQPHAIELTGGDLQPDPGGLGRYIVEMGADQRSRIHARLEYWKPAPLRQWEVWEDPATEPRIWEWLRQYQPAAEVLLEIDRRLLQMVGVRT